MSYDNSNQAAIWKNEDRETDKHPHFKGSAEVGGVEYWVSAWKRDPDGNPKAPALKLKFKPKDEAHREGVSEARQAVETPKQPAGDFDDLDVPF